MVFFMQHLILTVVLLISFILEMYKKNWTTEDDTLIIQLVKRFGSGKWTYISKMLRQNFSTKRSEKQIRQRYLQILHRWHNHLNPDIIKKAWCQEEQKKLFSAHRIYGNKWSQIAKLFPGRTDNCIKNHFYSTLRRTLRKLNKQLGDKQSAEIIKIIRPKCLTNMFMIADKKEQEIDNKSLYNSCKNLKELLTEAMDNQQSKKNLSCILQRKQYFKKILLHIKQLNQPNQQQSEKQKQSLSLNKTQTSLNNQEIEFYYNYQELEILKYEIHCAEYSITNPTNPREFFKIIDDFNIRSIYEETYKLSMLQFDGRSLQTFYCDKGNFLGLMNEKLAEKKEVIEEIIKGEEGIVRDVNFLPNQFLQYNR